MKLAFIYGLRCPLTGLIRYVGKCDNPQKRLTVHLADFKKNHRTNWIKSLTKQGLKPSLEIIAEVPWEGWQFWERSYIRLYRVLGFDLVNSTDGGEGCFNPTPETRAKMSAVQKGKKHSLETRAKIGAKAARKGKDNSNFGKTTSSEVRAKISASLKGEKNHFFGKNHSPEALAKMSAAGKNRSPETLAKMSAASKGRKHSSEAREKMSATRTTSGFTGVTWAADRKKWRVYFSSGGRNLFFGNFSKVEDAVFVRALAVDKHYGNNY